MKKSEQFELKTIIDHITQPNYDSIDHGISLLVSSGKDIYFEKILNNCKIIDGCLIASRRYTVTAPRQPFIDYALWNIIGLKPKSVKVHRSLSKASIKKVRVSAYESYLHWFNRIEKFPHGITFLENIEILDLTAARIKFIPDDIARLYKLKIIDVFNNDIDEFPIGLCKIDTLKSIDLNSNNIKVIPHDIAKLKNLEYLYLDSNEINTLPKGIKELQKLKCLSISNNNITEIPLEICDMVNLDKICISNNNIKYIPEAFANLQNITELDLSGNDLNSIPNLHSKTIKSLNLNRNKIKILNDCIKNMIGLESLYLNENRELKLVEPGITSLQYLKNIELGKTGNLFPKPHVLYLNGRENIEKYFNKILYHYKLRDRFKKESINSTVVNNSNKSKNYRYYKEDNEKIPKVIEGIISNLSNYFNSKELDVIDVGISITTSISNESVYNYIFGKWKMIKGELSQMYYYNGFEFERYHFRKYILLKLLTAKKNEVKIQRDISMENIKCLDYEFFEKRYPDFIFSLLNLTKIDFRLNKTDLRDDIYQLTKLEEIRLHEAINIDALKFDKFPDLKTLKIEKASTNSHLTFEYIRNLNKLIIDSVNAQSISITNNDNLEEISLYGIKIENIEILNCRNLKKLRIVSCELSKGNKFSYFPELVELTIERSGIIGLMNFISNCPRLEKVSIENIYGFKLDKSIENIKNIKSLNLKDNGIDHIPDEIGELEKLEYFNISKNNIRKIPTSIAKCKSLKYLDIRFQSGETKAENKLNDIPVDLFQIKKIKSIQVSWTSLELRKFESKLSESNLYQKSRIISNE